MRYFAGKNRSAFTLIELLVVIAIIAILTVVVILTLNPAELLRQSRDSNRLSDMATITDAINVYSTDQSGGSTFSMGSASTTYVDIADPTATSTAGDQCQGIGLPALSTSTGWNYHCPASSTPNGVNGTGWIPVNFSAISSGAPFGTLPVDITNQTSSNLYYTYATDGTKYAVTVALESQKYLKQYLLNSNTDPARVAAGSNLSLIPSEEGLVGWWTFGEGSSSFASDYSGQGNTLAWQGTGTHYSTSAKIGTYAGQFNHVTGDCATSTASPDSSISNWTISFWAKPTTLAEGQWGTGHALFVSNGDSAGNTGYGIGMNNAGQLEEQNYGLSVLAPGYTFPAANQWYFIATERTTSTITMFANGTQLPVTSAVAPGAISQTFSIGCKPFSLSDSFLDDVRFYNRVLSAAEIQAIYNAEK
jgi:prepilin-type N-terminal cleavage/methylation domain-containing protein